jgi:hypothetical protein
LLSYYSNKFASTLVSAPGLTHDPHRALSLARRAVELAPTQNIYLNTLGAAQYRAGQHAEAVATLEKSLAAGKGETDAFDLFSAPARPSRVEYRALVDQVRAVLGDRPQVDSAALLAPDRVR